MKLSEKLAAIAAEMENEPQLFSLRKELLSIISVLKYWESENA